MDTDSAVMSNDKEHESESSRKKESKISAIVSSKHSSKTGGEASRPDTSLSRFGNVRLFNPSETESHSTEVARPHSSSSNISKTEKHTGIGRAEVEAALSRFGNVRLFSAPPLESEEGAGEVGYASGETYFLKWYVQSEVKSVGCASGETLFCPWMRRTLHLVLFCGF